MEIEIYEDNSGAVYLSNGSEAWNLGPVTPDMYGRAAEDAQAWAAGDWRPNENDGQSRADIDELEHIATWAGGQLVIQYDTNGEPSTGAGGANYLGIVDGHLLTISEVAAYWAVSESRARHILADNGVKSGYDPDQVKAIPRPGQGARTDLKGTR